MIEQQTFTFAAICQAAKMVQNLARTGQLNADDLAVLLTSITITSPRSTLDVYGGNLNGLSLGFNTLLAQLDNNTSNNAANQAGDKDPELTRYVISLLALERKLAKKPKLLAELGKRIEQVDRQLAHYDITSETVIASLASIYSDLISPIGAKIQISGEPEILKQNVNQQKVRALLLAGIRSAVLWRQVGGKRRHLVFGRAKMVECAKRLR